MGRLRLGSLGWLVFGGFGRKFHLGYRGLEYIEDNKPMKLRVVFIGNSF